MRLTWGTAVHWVFNAIAVICVCYIAWIYGTKLFEVKPVQNTRALHTQTPLYVNGSALQMPTDNNLVLFLSPTCGFCRESIPFYQRLLALSSHGGVHFMAVFREPVGDARAYMQQSGLGAIADVRQVDFSASGVDMTPTLAVVDRSGTVRAFWVGMLTPQKEGEVMDVLSISHAGSGLSSTIQKQSGNKGVPADASDSAAMAAAAAQLRNELLGNNKVAVVDVRERSEFAASHLTVAQNIPLDEIEVRASHEVGKQASIRLYCEFRESCNDLARSGVSGPCDVAATIFHFAGYKDVGIIRADLSALNSAGVSVMTALPGLEQIAAKRLK